MHLASLFFILVLLACAGFVAIVKVIFHHSSNYHSVAFLLLQVLSIILPHLDATTVYNILPLSLSPFEIAMDVNLSEGAN